MLTPAASSLFPLMGSAAAGLAPVLWATQFVHDLKNENWPQAYSKETTFGFPPIVREAAESMYEWMEKHLEDPRTRFVAQSNVWPALTRQWMRHHKKAEQALEVFPGAERFTETISPLDSLYFEPKLRNPLTYYSAMAYLSLALIDPLVFHRLLAGARLLSVGAGPAHLERFLHLFGGIPASQIEIADLVVHQPPLRSGFRCYEFDMTKTEAWPETGLYDYILFPASFGPAHDHMPRMELWGAIDTAERVINGDLATFTEEEKTMFVQKMNKASPYPAQKFHTLTEAYKRLAPSGEMRLYNYYLEQSEIAYMAIRLQKLWPESHLSGIGATRLRHNGWIIGTYTVLVIKNVGKPDPCILE